MAIHYSNTPHDIFTEGPSLTEQEHKDSCDINKMVLSAMKGLDVRGRPIGPWGDGAHDDMTMDGLQHRIQKQLVEEELENGPKEFTQAEFDLIPHSIREKFGFKVKQQETAHANDDLNDDPRANTPAPTQPPTQPEKTQP